MIHVTYEWVMSHMNESCHIWMSHVTTDRNSCQIAAGTHVIYWMEHVSCAMSCEVSCYVCTKMCYFWMSHARVNESCHIRAEIVAQNRHIRCWDLGRESHFLYSMSHVTYKWVMSHMNESCHIWMGHVTCEWVTSHMIESCHIWMSHVTYE